MRVESIWISDFRIVVKVVNFVGIRKNSLETIHRSIVTPQPVFEAVSVWGRDDGRMVGVTGFMHS